MKGTPVSCVGAYNSISVNADGSIEPCCQYMRDKAIAPIQFTEFTKYQDTIQQAMVRDAESNIQHSGCIKCWREESAGWKTLRSYFDDWYLKDSSDSVDPNNPLYDIELRLGNFCNLKCIMCGPYASSSLGLERSQNLEKFQAINLPAENVKCDYYWEDPAFWEFSEKLFKDARRVNITGGEPFIIPEVTNIIAKLLPKKDTVNLSFNTNLTKVSDKLINLLREFKHLSIVISLEGVEEMNDYLRYPSEWGQLLENFTKVKTQLPNAHVTVNHTFQHSSIYAIPNLATFCLKNKIDLFLTSVQGNERLTINSVPPEDLARFKTWAETTDSLTNTVQRQILGFIKTYNYNSQLHCDYYNYVTLLDEIRGTDYYGVFKTETKYIDN